MENKNTNHMTTKVFFQFGEVGGLAIIYKKN
jgi:hypothetical protein